MNILDIIFNPLIFTSIIVIGVIAYFMTHFKPEKRVELLRPRDRRGQILSVVKETDLGLTCGKSGGVAHSFIKTGAGWTFNVGGKSIVKFFGMEGTAYTSRVEGDPAKIKVWEYVKQVWGEQIYNKIPKEQKELLETALVGVTVEPIKITEEDYKLPTITGDDVHDEDDNVMLRRFAKSSSEGTGDGRSKIWNMIIFAALGFFICYFFVARGVI